MPPWWSQQSRGPGPAMTGAGGAPGFPLPPRLAAEGAAVGDLWAASRRLRQGQRWGWCWSGELWWLLGRLSRLHLWGRGPGAIVAPQALISRQVLVLSPMWPAPLFPCEPLQGLRLPQGVPRCPACLAIPGHLCSLRSLEVLLGSPGTECRGPSPPMGLMNSFAWHSGMGGALQWGSAGVLL